MPRIDHDTHGMVYACPHCDNTHIYQRIGDNTEYATEYEYICRDCNNGFDQPNERQDKRKESASPDVVPDNSDRTISPEDLQNPNRLPTTYGAKPTWKPDPDQPWRYACPNCGSAGLTATPFDSTEDAVQCAACDWYGRESDLLDKKTDDVTPTVGATTMTETNSNLETVRQSPSTSDTEYNRKPDPDQPWRYGCPDCGTTALQRYPVASKEDGVECNKCGWYGRLSELDDKKTDDVTPNARQPQ